MPVFDRKSPRSWDPLWGDKRLASGKGKLKVTLSSLKAVFKNNKARLVCKNVVLLMHCK